MGEVSVLHPHDFLGQHPPLPHLHPSSPLNTPPKDSSSVNCPKPSHQTRRKRNSRSVVTPSKTTPPPPPHSSENLVMGQVKILRRGEVLPVEASTGLLHLPPDEFVQIQSPVTEFFQSDPVRPVVNGFYAGSAAFVASPPPSSVPLPGFFTKRGGSGSFSAFDGATSDLRRILRLD